MAKKKENVHLALPSSLELPADELQVRLDFYRDVVMMTDATGKKRTVRMVSANDVAMAMLRETPLSSGILPLDVLWWAQSREGPEVALWRKPQVWQVALQEDIDTPVHRFKLPMPGLVFVCRPAAPPKVFAAKERPKAKNTQLFHAPLPNINPGGMSCQGSHKYPRRVEEIPESFFLAFFSHGATPGRSTKYPKNLLDLWREIDGKRIYPTGDLMPCGTVGDVMDQKGRWVHGHY